MGLKSKLNKMKNFLFDDEDVEEPVVKKSKKKEKKVDFEEKYEEENKSTVNDFEDYFEDVSDSKEEMIIPQSRVEKQEFKIPEFNDEDFMVETTKPKSIIEDIKPVIKEEKPILYQGSRKRKEETKRFKPSPIISPIYGLLDEKGNRVSEDKETVANMLNNKEEVSIDDVRKKAYGSLDNEIEDTLKRLSSKTIEEAEKELEEKEEKLSRTKKNIKEDKKAEVFSPVEIEAEEDDDMILPNVNFKEIDVDIETKVKSTKKKKEATKKEIEVDDEEDDDDTKEQDLFNLIDTMYAKEGEE